MADVPMSYAEMRHVLRDLPNTMREARRARHLTSSAAARELGMRQSVYSGYERGEVHPTLTRIDRILGWLDTPTPAPAQAHGEADG